MKLISVNLGLPREITHEGQAVTTGIFKAPVAEPEWIGRLNLGCDGLDEAR
jgi:MOSC domain-containing protein YiiM